MTTIQWVVFAVVIAITIYAYFEIASSLNPIKQIRGMLGLFVLMLTVSISLFLVFITSNLNDKLSIKNKAKCPEYVLIEGAYTLKK